MWVLNAWTRKERDSGDENFLQNKKIPTRIHTVQSIKDVFLSLEIILQLTE